MDNAIFKMKNANQKIKEAEHAHAVAAARTERRKELFIKVLKLSTKNQKEKQTFFSSVNDQWPTINKLLLSTFTQPFHISLTR